MRCDDFEALVSDYLDGDLDPLTRQRALAHVGRCPGCAEVLEGVRQVRWSLRQLADQPEGAIFRLRLSTCLGQEAARSTAPRPGALAVALAVAAALATVLWPSRPVEPPRQWVVRAPEVTAIQPTGPYVQAPGAGMAQWPSHRPLRVAPVARPVSY